MGGLFYLRFFSSPFHFAIRSPAARALRETLVRDHPSVLGYAVGLGGTYCNLGNLVKHGGQAEGALDWYNKAIAAIETVW